MRILITGATGLIGSHIVSLCHEHKFSVNFLTTDRKAVIQRENYRGFYWNPDKGTIDPACFDGVSAMINLSGATIAQRWTTSRKSRILNSRINSLRTLAKGLEESGSDAVTTMISASAIGGYPNSLSEFYQEDFKAFDNSFLGDVVAAWEREADTFKRYGLKVAKIRIGLVLSGDGGALPKIIRPVKYYAGATFGSGEQWQSWIHIHDLARLFLFVMNQGLEGLYNGVAPNPVTNTKLIREVARVVNRPLLLPNIPKFLLKMVLGEMSYLLVSSQRVSSKKIEERGFDFQFSNICRALQDLYGADEGVVSKPSKARSEFLHE